MFYKLSAGVLIINILHAEHKMLKTLTLKTKIAEKQNVNRAKMSIKTPK